MRSNIFLHTYRMFRNVFAGIGLGTPEYTKIFSRIERYLISLPYQNNDYDLSPIETDIQSLMKSSITLDYIKQNIQDYLSNLRNGTPYTTFNEEPIAGTRQTSFGNIPTLISPERQGVVTEKIKTFANSNSIIKYIIIQILTQQIANINNAFTNLDEYINETTDAREKATAEKEKIRDKPLQDAIQPMQALITSLGPMNGGRRTRRFLRKRRSNKRRSSRK